MFSVSLSEYHVASSILYYISTNIFKIYIIILSQLLPSFYPVLPLPFLTKTVENKEHVMSGKVALLNIYLFITWLDIGLPNTSYVKYMCSKGPEHYIQKIYLGSSNVNLFIVRTTFMHL